MRGPYFSLNLLSLIICLFVLLTSLPLSAQNNGKKANPAIFQSSEWVDSMINDMTLKEKIGQLFMVAAYSNRGKEHRQAINRLINKYHIGGLIFFQGNPYKQARLTNHYQSESETPLLIAMDAEWGLPMRLSSTMSFPTQMTFGAIQEDRLIYEMGRRIANQCKRLGVHINFAPVADINNHPQNPVIHTRSFGEDKQNIEAEISRN
jgi:beta-glucosidase-like glycosyl hydrolase